MQNSRLLGIVLLAVGFVGAVAAGLFFAVQTQSGTDVTDVLFSAVWVFLGVLPLLVGGIYLYNRSDEVEPADSDVTRQLVLLDYLREQNREVSITMIGESLGWTEDLVIQSLNALIDLDLFCGYWDKTDNRLQLLSLNALNGLDRCHSCNTPLHIEYLPFTCPNCEATYYSTVV